MDFIYRATTKVINFASKPVAPKTKLSALTHLKKFRFLRPIQTETHNPERINFAIKITQNKLNKSIKHNLNLFQHFEKRKKKLKKKNFWCSTKSSKWNKKQASKSKTLKIYQIKI